jgi:hypothetical protein
VFPDTCVKWQHQHVRWEAQNVQKSTSGRCSTKPHVHSMKFGNAVPSACINWSVYKQHLACHTNIAIAIAQGQGKLPAEARWLPDSDLIFCSIHSHLAMVHVVVSSECSSMGAWSRRSFSAAANWQAGAVARCALRDGFKAVSALKVGQNTGMRMPAESPK